MISDALKRRMGELRIRRSDLSEASGMPIATLGRLIDGKTKRLRDPDAEDRLERALGWVSGTFDSIRHGMGPIPIDERIDWPSETGTYADAVEAAWARLEQRLSETIEGMPDEVSPHYGPDVSNSPVASGFEALEPALRSHLDQRHLDIARRWPLWLAERLANILNAPGAETSTTAQLAGSVIGVEYLTEVAQVLDSRRLGSRGAPGGGGDVTSAMRADIARATMPARHAPSDRPS